MPGKECWNNDSWDELIDDIEAGVVIPIVGGGLVTVDENERFDTWLATKLAEKLGVNLSSSGPRYNVNQVAQAYFTNSKADPDTLHARIKSTITGNTFKPSQSLLDLARIKPFKLFLTTTYDGILEAALNEVRSNENVTSISLAKGKRQDLPENWQIVGATLVYLLGSYLDSPNFAAWDADIIDHVLDLHVRLGNEDLKNLARVLQEKKLLLLGMRFGDWLTRFFIHLVRRPPWHLDTKPTYIAEPDVFAMETFVLFVQGRRGETRFIPGDPEAFAGELYLRWADRARLTKKIEDRKSAQSQMDKALEGAVFLSYSRKDKEAAKTLYEGLKKAGCDVWFDEFELNPGEAYTDTMERRIRRDCGAFISIISKNTENDEGFFHMERDWAKTRAIYYGATGGFYIPVIVDPQMSAQDLRKEPLPRHVRVNVVTLPNGEPNSDFCKYLIGLQTQFRNKRAKN